jgi:hypothetical protein
MDAALKDETGIASGNGIGHGAADAHQGLLITKDCIWK